MTLRSGDIVEIVTPIEEFKDLAGKTGVIFMAADGEVYARTDTGTLTLKQCGMRVVKPFRTEKELLEDLLDQAEQQTELLDRIYDHLIGDGHQ